MRVIFKKLYTLAFSIFAICLWSCSENTLYDDMPSKIQSFIAQYYPNSQLDSFKSSANGYTIVIKNGPTMVFDKDCKWIQINGNGSVLPQVLLFNDLPPDLYKYLQESEDTNNVFIVTRNDKEYILELLDYTLYYDIATGEITGKDDPPT